MIIFHVHPHVLYLSITLSLCTCMIANIINQVSIKWQSSQTQAVCACICYQAPPQMFYAFQIIDNSRILKSINVPITSTFYISSVYSPFSDRVELPLHNIFGSVNAEYWSIVFTTGCPSSTT